jgi:hypothetical protein
MEKDQTLPTIRVTKKLSDEIERYGHLTKKSNKSDIVRSLVVMGLQVWKITVNDSDWRISEVQTLIDSLTPEQREQVFSKYFEAHPEEVKRLRYLYREWKSDEERRRHEEELRLEKQKRRLEQEQRRADAAVLLQHLEVTELILQWVFGDSYRGREDEALQRLTHEKLDESQMQCLPLAFKRYLAQQNPPIIQGPPVVHERGGQ